MKIQYLPQAEINPEKWDHCIQHAVNGNPYGYSWYINCMADRWDALVMGDYEAVFPLIWNRRWFGFRRMYQPYFTQQHGVYATKSISPELLKAFLLEAARHFPRIYICINDQNLPIELPGFTFEPRANYLLSLDQDYELIQKGYSKSLRKRLRRSSDRYQLIEGPCTVMEMVNLYRQYQGDKLPCDDQDYQRVAGMMQKAIDHGIGKIMGLEGPDGLEVAGFFLFSHNRIINLLGTSTDTGREHYAMHCFLDQLIQRNANTPQIFDFEGSSIPSIAYFFSSFGSKSQPYYLLEYDRLPGWVKGIRYLVERWK